MVAFQKTGAMPMTVIKNHPNLLVRSHALLIDSITCDASNTIKTTENESRQTVSGSVLGSALPFPPDRWIRNTKIVDQHHGITILHEVSERLGLPVGEIRSHRNHAHLVEARAQVAWRLRNELGWSYPRIGKLLGGFHHTTIMYLLRTYPEV
jgi:Bacterial dnaA protein helix-turn-helix